MSNVRFLYGLIIAGLALVITCFVAFTFLSSEPTFVILGFIGSAITLMSANKISQLRSRGVPHRVETKRKQSMPALITVMVLLIVVTCIALIVIDDPVAKTLLFSLTGLCTLLVVVRVVITSGRNSKVGADPSSSSDSDQHS